ncbi:MAG TPA: hypothetical protein VF756_16370 [Thermoanaerobaculia bacterium]
MRDDENLETSETSQAQDQDPTSEAETTTGSECFDFDMEPPGALVDPPKP